MSGSLNRVMLVGNLGKEPKVSTLNSGDRVVNFTLATSESWKDKNTGEKRERTEWHNIVVYNENIGRVIEQYCKKGSKIYIEGQIQTRKYQDKGGGDRYITEIVLQRFRGEVLLLGSKDDDGGGRSEDRGATSRDEGSRPVHPRPGADLNDEIPFIANFT